MQIKSHLSLQRPESEFEKSIETELFRYTIDLARLLNKGLRFEDNFDFNIVTIANTGAADSEYVVPHTLMRVPIGCFAIKRNTYGVIAESGTAWTSTNIYIKCSVANTAVTLLVV